MLKAYMVAFPKFHLRTMKPDRQPVMTSDLVCHKFLVSEAWARDARHRDTIGVHFKTVLFYHFYHQDTWKRVREFSQV